MSVLIGVWQNKAHGSLDSSLSLCHPSRLKQKRAQRERGVSDLLLPYLRRRSDLRVVPCRDFFSFFLPLSARIRWTGAFVDQPRFEDQTRTRAYLFMRGAVFVGALIQNRPGVLILSPFPFFFPFLFFLLGPKISCHVGLTDGAHSTAILSCLSPENIN